MDYETCAECPSLLICCYDGYRHCETERRAHIAETILDCTDEETLEGGLAIERGWGKRG